MNVGDSLIALAFNLPRIIDLVAHYQEIVSRPDARPEDAAKAKVFLEGARWTPFDVLEKERG